MRSADDNRYSPVMISLCEAVCVRRGSRICRNSNKRKRFVKADFLDDFVGVCDPPVRRRVRSQQRHRELREANDSPVTNESGGVGFSRDQFDPVSMFRHPLPSLAKRAILLPPGIRMFLTQE